MTHHEDNTTISRVMETLIDNGMERGVTFRALPCSKNPFIGELGFNIRL